MVDKIIGYFDLNSEARAKRAKAVGDDAVPGGPSVPAWLQYLALVLGIVIQPSFAAYQQNHQWSMPLGPGFILFSVIVGLVIFPAVYKKTFDDTDPKLVSIAPIFTAGLGWQSLLTTALAAGGGSTAVTG